MRYLAIIDGGEYQFDLEETQSGMYRLRIGTEEFELDLRRVGASSFSILAGSRSFDFDVVPDGDELLVVEHGGVTRVQLIDPRRALRGGAAGHEVKGRAEIKAMMPGRVVNVLLKAGDHVEAGQGVLVVEAMKMENEIKAPKAGIVTEVRVAAGQTVEKNDLLVIIE